MYYSDFYTLDNYRCTAQYSNQYIDISDSKDGSKIEDCCHRRVRILQTGTTTGILISVVISVMLSFKMKLQLPVISYTD
jgi:hypothetical protein